MGSQGHHSGGQRYLRNDRLRSSHSCNQTGKNPGRSLIAVWSIAGQTGRSKPQRIQPQRHRLPCLVPRLQPLGTLARVHVQRQQALHRAVHFHVQPLPGKRGVFQAFVLDAGNGLVVRGC